MTQTYSKGCGTPGTFLTKTSKLRKDGVQHRDDKRVRGCHSVNILEYLDMTMTAIKENSDKNFPQNKKSLRTDDEHLRIQHTPCQTLNQHVNMHFEYVGWPSARVQPTHRALWVAARVWPHEKDLTGTEYINVEDSQTSRIRRPVASGPVTPTSAPLGSKSNPNTKRSRVSWHDNWGV